MASKRCRSPEYRREYARLIRHVSYYLGEALPFDQDDSSVIYSESQVIEMLYATAGIRLMPETLSKELNKLEKHYGEAPLECFYRLRKGWFERHSPKAPKHYHRK